MRIARFSITERKECDRAVENFVTFFCNNINFSTCKKNLFVFFNLKKKAAFFRKIIRRAQMKNNTVKNLAKKNKLTDFVNAPRSVMDILRLIVGKERGKRGMRA